MRSTSSSTRANIPGRRRPSELGTQAFSPSRRLSVSRAGEMKVDHASRNVRPGTRLPARILRDPARASAIAFPGSENCSCRRSTASIWTSATSESTRISGRDIARAQRTVEWRANSRPLDVDSREIHHGLRGRYSGARPGQLRSRRDPDLRKLLGALENIGSQHPIRFGFAQLRALLLRAEHEKRVACCNPLSFLKLDRLDDTRYLGPNDHGLGRRELTDDFDTFGKQPRLDASGFDHARRWAFRRLQCIRVAAHRRQRKQGEHRAKPLFDERSTISRMLSRVWSERCRGSASRHVGREAPRVYCRTLFSFLNGNPMNPSLAFWTAALIDLLAIVALVAIGIRSIRRGNLPQHRRCMKTAAALVACFLGIYPLKVLWFGRERLPEWSEQAVAILRIHELCVFAMLVGGADRADSQPKDAPQPQRADSAARRPTRFEPHASETPQGGLDRRDRSWTRVSHSGYRARGDVRAGGRSLNAALRGRRIADLRLRGDRRWHCGRFGRLRAAIAGANATARAGAPSGPPHHRALCRVQRRELRQSA